MRKHLIRMVIAYSCFELMRTLGGELPEMFGSGEVFGWTRDTKKVTFQLSGFFIFMLYPLLSFLIFLKWYRTEKRKAVVYLTATIMAIISFRFLLEEIIVLSVFGFHNYYDGVPLLFYLVDNLYYAIIYSAFGLVYFFLINEQKRRIEQQHLEIENRKAQLSFLYAQINPHFLFNSLNNIYSLIYYKSEASLEAVSKLCDMLRYMLYEKSEKVPLSKEWDYIQKYIYLQSLRFSKPPDIKVLSEGDTSFAPIPPLLLIPFVENAFKHGDFKSEGSHLAIQLVSSEHKICFSVSNTKTKVAKGTAGGIGLTNTKQRLQLLYPGKHELTVKEDAQLYCVQLQLIN